MSKDNLGLVRVAAACPEVAIADIDTNISRMADMCRDIDTKCRPSIITFPELSVTGYSCEEMFNQQVLYDNVENGVSRFLELTADIDALIAIGLPVNYNSRRYNVAAIIRKGRILGMVPKIYLPGNNEFYEGRYFESGAQLGSALKDMHYAGCDFKLGVLQIFDMGKARIGIEVCQDLWVPIPPCSYAALSGANVILNLSASNEVLGKQDYRKTLLSSTSSRLHVAYVYSSSGYGESSDDLVWAGSSLIYENGELLCENDRFRTASSEIVADIDLDEIEQSRLKYVNFSRDGQAWADAWPFDGNAGTYTHVPCGECVDTDFERSFYRKLDKNPFLPGGIEARASQCRECFNIQVAGLITRLRHIHCQKSIIGVSGGLDSTLALLVTCEAFDRIGLPRHNIIAVTMPCFGTSERTYNNANDLMKELGVTLRDIDIANACTLHMQDIGLDPDVHNTAYENSQARERTQILMDIANAEGGIVIGTGDLSELALGWCTYNGDHMSMYGVNAGVPKTLIREIVRWRSETLSCKDTLVDILDTPVSPELVPGAQMTEDIVGPYELHDFFLWHFFESKSPAKIFFLASKAFSGDYSKEFIYKWLKVFYRRFFSQQFKRSCLPNGPKVCEVSLSPRGDWRMSTDTVPTVWMNELDKIKI